jgi:hypothetical protein
MLFEWLVCPTKSLYYCVNDLHIKDGNIKAMILRWLGQISQPLSFDEIQHKMFQISKKTPGAGQRLLSSRNFIDWRDDWSDGGMRKMWYYGIRKKILPNFPIFVKTNSISENRKNCACVRERLFICNTFNLQVLTFRPADRLSSTISRLFTRTNEV